MEWLIKRKIPPLLTKIKYVVGGNSHDHEKIEEAYNSVATLYYFFRVLIDVFLRRCAMQASKAASTHDEEIVEE